MTSPTALTAAADRVGEAIHQHAAACQRDPDDVATVVRAGEALVAAVLEYEKALRAGTGWSNPIRHLGDLPMFGDQDRFDPVPAHAGRSPVRIAVRVTYHLHTDDDDAVLAFVSGRYATEISGLGEAIQALVRAEGWDPERYPPGLLVVEDALVDVTVDASSAAEVTPPEP